MNKLVFTFKNDWNADVVLIANNHKDLEDYLNSNYDWFKIEVGENIVIIKERDGYEDETATLQWVKHI